MRDLTRPANVRSASSVVAPPVVQPLPGLPDVPGFSHGLSSRIGGVSAPPFDQLNLGLHVGDDPAAVVENRRRLALALGIRLDDVVVAEQVHGSDVARVGHAQRGSGATDTASAIRGADALITDAADVALLVQVADCAPVLLVDPVRRALGVAHAGWRGALGGVAANAARAMIDQLGCRPEDIWVGVGPHIGLDQFEVGEAVVSAVAEREGIGSERRDAIQRWLRPKGERWHLDLGAVLRDQLRAVGVTDSRITIDPRSTMAEPETWYSYRASSRTGRFGVLACWRDES